MKEILNLEVNLGSTSLLSSKAFGHSILNGLKFWKVYFDIWSFRDICDIYFCVPVRGDKPSKKKSFNLNLPVNTAIKQKKPIEYRCITYILIILFYFPFKSLCLLGLKNEFQKNLYIQQHFTKCFWIYEFMCSTSFHLRQSSMTNSTDILTSVFHILWQVAEYYWNFHLEECKKNRFQVIVISILNYKHQHLFM